jgi:thiosulfate reductase cytochrome b subunit
MKVEKVKKLKSGKVWHQFFKYLFHFCTLFYVYIALSLEDQTRKGSAVY